MQSSLNFFVTVLVLMSGFSVIVRKKSSGRTLLHAVFFVSAVISAAIFTSSPKIFVILAGIFVLVVEPVTIYARKTRNERWIEAQIPLVLTRLILNLKCGRGLRESLRLEHEQFRISQVEEVLNHLEDASASAIKNKKWAEFADFLQHLDRDPARVIHRLERLRYKLRVERDYKKRVDQILAQPKLQAVIAIFLYAALVFFVAFSFPKNFWITYFLVSAPIELLGVVWLINMGRSFRWKV